MIALWAEADLIVADQLHDGNVPAKREPLSCCQMAFEALPETVRERYFRGDSACYENNLLDWLSSPQREQEPGGRRAHRLRHQCGNESAVGAQTIAKSAVITLLLLFAGIVADSLAP